MSTPNEPWPGTPEQPAPPATPVPSSDAPPPRRARNPRFVALATLAALIPTGLTTTAVYFANRSAPVDTTTSTTSERTYFGTSSGPTDIAGPRDTVVFEVTGDGTAAGNVLYTYVASPDIPRTGQTARVNLPYSKSLTVAHPAGVAQFALVAQQVDGTSISCKITVNGVVVSAQTSAAAVRSVACGASR